ncbi:DUF6114 domain-containing protein [Halomicrococcus sp. NG-SE-24]|uniref:DUF6114 domain-containing protein n=1 Tax=Halomicrococcus sp. NG-SE-24 TaxID=3436928 RepID=UPI003D99F40C
MTPQSVETRLRTIRNSVSRPRLPFKEYRSRRPFLGGVLLCVAGLLIGWVPLQFATELIFVGGSYTFIGLFFAAGVFLSGVFTFMRPEFSTQLGIVGVAFSILSLFGALGGLLVGMIIGIIGSSLCISWTPKEVTEDEPNTSDESTE